jgi:branched-chain amino acid transport system permease protein
MITIAFFSIANSISGYVLGDEQQPFPSPFGTDSINIAGVGISYLSIGLIVIALSIVILIYLGFKFTRIGLLFEAIAQNTVAARLRGIHASNLLSFAWGISVLMSAISGILLAPTLFLSPSMLTGIYVYALIAVVIGGLESPFGAFLGGIIVGVCENLATNISFIGSGLKFTSVFVLLVIVLIIRPRGIWGRDEGRKV